MSWKDELLQMDIDEEKDLTFIHYQEEEKKEQDIGMVHPDHGAGFLIREDQTVEMFADDQLGFRMNPETNTFSIYAPHIKFICQTQEVHQIEKELSYFQEEYNDILKLLGG